MGNLFANTCWAQHIQTVNVRQKLAMQRREAYQQRAGLHAYECVHQRFRFHNEALNSVRQALTDAQSKASASDSRTTDEIFRWDINIIGRTWMRRVLVSFHDPGLLSIALVQQWGQRDESLACTPVPGFDYHVTHRLLLGANADEFRVTIPVDGVTEDPPLVLSNDNCDDGYNGYNGHQDLDADREEALYRDAMPDGPLLLIMYTATGTVGSSLSDLVGLAQLAELLNNSAKLPKQAVLEIQVA